MAKPQTIVSGIRASGRLHIGSYLGALKQFVDLQNTGEHRYYFFIADLHALTTPFEPKELKKHTLEIVAEYLAAGVDPEKSVLFLQNHVPEHAELAWIFDCITPLGELERMTQFKDKAKQQRENVNAGLLNYPALMAADILIYKPHLVPVGEDQQQHLELTRAIARRFNSRFGKTFPEPENYLTKPLRIKSLTDPDKKMSKTGDEALMLDDPPAEIQRKLKKAVTATDAKQASPGVDNLLLLLRHFSNKQRIQYFEDNIKNNSIKYSELKETLAKDIAKHFAEFRQRKKEILADKDYLAEVLAEGARKAKKTASETLREVKQKIGLV